MRKCITIMQIRIYLGLETMTHLLQTNTIRFLHWSSSSPEGLKSFKKICVNLKKKIYHLNTIIHLLDLLYRPLNSISGLKKLI